MDIERMETHLYISIYDIFTIQKFCLFLSIVISFQDIKYVKIKPLKLHWFLSFLGSLIHFICLAFYSFSSFLLRLYLFRRLNFSHQNGRGVTEIFCNSAPNTCIASPIFSTHTRRLIYYNLWTSPSPKAHSLRLGSLLVSYILWVWVNA